MINQVILVGRLVKDIELNYTKNNVAIAKFALAVPRNYKDADGEYGTDFINCIAYKKSAETTAKYCRKGDLIGIKGEIRTSSYENKEGKKVYVTEVLSDKITFLTSKKEEVKPSEEKADPFEEFGEQIEITDEDENSSLDLPF